MCRMTMMAALVLYMGMTACGGAENAQSNAQDAEEFGQSEAKLWTGFTSEEYPPLQCDTMQLINGVECKGSYCDNIRVNCTNAGVVHGSSSFTTWFSEEGSADYRICGANEWVTGIACNGGYCDNVSLECTSIPGRSVGECIYSRWYTDGSGPWNAPPGYYMRGAQCSGDSCDDMRFYYCAMI